MDLKLITELTYRGVFTDKCGLGLIHHEIKALLEFDKENHENVHHVLAIMKLIGEDVMGFVPPQIRILCEKFGIEVPQVSVIEPKKRTHFINLSNEYYDGLAKHLKTEYDLLKKMEKTNRHIYQQVKIII